MEFLNKRFMKNKGQYILQCILAGVLTAGILFIFAMVLKMDILGAIGASSLASSTCLLFIAPDSKMSQTKNLLGAYTIGLLVGALSYYAANVVYGFYPDIFTAYDVIFLGAVAVAVTQLLMLLFGVEHSPGAGLAIGLVLEDWQFKSIIVIALCVLIIAFIHYVLQKRLISLV